MWQKMSTLRKIFLLCAIGAINIVIYWLVLPSPDIRDSWKHIKYAGTNGSASLLIKVQESKKNYPTTRNLIKESTLHKKGHSSESNKCPDVLEGMTQGRWMTRPLTLQEQITIDEYLQDERAAYHIPFTYQRSDGRCGDIAYKRSPLYRHMWFKAICNPKGQTPCCLTNRCVSLPVDKCRCPTCYDERQAIHAEYATWKPDDERFDVKNFTSEQACSLLRGSTVYFVGDSFIRHVFAAFVILLTGNMDDGALRKNIHPLQRDRCKGMHQITGLTCRELLNEKRLLCNGTVRVRYVQVFPAREFPFTTPLLRSLRHVNKSLVVLGLGIHDDFNVTTVARKFLLPFLNLRQHLSTNLTSNLDLRNVLTYFRDSDFYNGNSSTKTSSFHFIQKKNASEEAEPRYELLQQNDPDQIMRDIGIDFQRMNMLNKPYNPSWQQFISRSGFGLFNHIGPSLGGSTDLSKEWHISSVKNNTQSNTIKEIQNEHKNFRDTFQESTKTLEKLRYIANNFTNETVIFRDFPQAGVDVKNLWPRLLWVGTHAPGLLKSPKFVAQTPQGVKNYNQKVSRILKKWHVPFLDTFSFTDGTISFDGTHYGYGINMLKVNMILTYIQESLAKEWTSP